jgi:hypothetical protein
MLLRQQKETLQQIASFVGAEILYGLEEAK